MDKTLQIGLILVAYDKMTKVLKAATGEAIESFSRLQEKIKQTSEKLAMVGTASYFAGSQILYSMKKPIDAFMELEDASTQLKVTLMKDTGEISEKFEEINKIAAKLGAELPGTTSDFYRMASYMKALGITEESIAGGALEAAAKLGAVLKPFGVTYEEAAISVAKFKESLGIADKELISFMDIIQRVAHQGVKLEEMRYVFADLAGTLQPLGIQGLEASKSITSLVAMLIKTGRTGMEVGNAISDMIRQSMDIERVSKANQMLSQFGIQLNFVDEQTGKFKGIENLIVQLDKLKELPDAVRMEVFKAIFGAGSAMAVANIIATKGIEGYNQMIDRMKEQASLNKRVEESLGTLRNMWEAFTGTFQNALAAIGKGAAPLLKWLANTLNNISEAIGNFAEKHKTLTTIISSGAVILGGALMVFGSLGIALSVVLRLSGAAIKGFMIFGSLAKAVAPILISSLKAITVAFRVFSVTAIAGLRAVAVAMLTNPIGWILLGITALVAAGYLLYRNWDKVSKALSSAWNWLRENWKKLLQVFMWVNPITMPIMALNKLVKYVFGIDLFSAGKKIIETLWKGIQSVAMKPVEAVKNIVQKIRNFLPFSPAKEGPFKDLHKIRLIETIAEGMKASPLVVAMKQVLEPVKAVMQPLIQPVKQVLEPVKATGTAQAVRASNITVNYSPSINISGAVAQAKEDLMAMLRQHQAELLKLIQDAQAKAQRVAY